MKGRFALFVSVVFFVGVFSACGNAEKLPPIDFAVAQIDVTHFKSGHITSWTLDAQKVVSDLEEWFNGLSLQLKQFKEGQSPGDMDGGEVFSFQLEAVENSFSYIKNGSDECYILYGEQWYKVKNPQDPLSENDIPLNASSPAQSPNVLVPTIMLDDILYYLAGEGSLTIEVDESKYLGRVTSIVPVTEWPTENGQANIPVEGVPYAKYNDGIILLWNAEWQLFKARN